MQPTTRYHIVKFTFGLPYPSCSGYECVPQCWLTFHDHEKEAAIIAYPNCAVDDIADHLKNAKRYDTSWNKFAVQVIFSTDNYEEARVSLQLFQSDTSSNTSEDTNTDCVTKVETQHTSTADLPPAVASQHTPQNTANTPAQTRVRADRVNEQKAKPGPKRKSVREPEIDINMQLLPDIDHNALQKLDEIEALFNKSQDMILKLKNTDECLLTNKIDVFLKSLDKNQCKALDNNDNTRKIKFKRHKNTILVKKTKKVNKLKNSRWTLRHPKLRAGLVQLIPNSKVYVNKENLKIYLTATEGSNLIRALLCEVFSDEALSKCCLTGFNSRRPPLDSHARKALFKFVTKCVNERNWADWTEEKIRKCIYNKLERIRYTGIIGNPMLDM